jgi:hypothetical protein
MKLKKPVLKINVFSIKMFCIKKCFYICLNLKIKNMIDQNNFNRLHRVTIVNSEKKVIESRTFISLEIATDFYINCMANKYSHYYKISITSIQK